MEFFNSIWAFIVAIGILVAFHEFGHYWTAKKLGVKVLRFSVGFGPVIWKKIAGKDQTEYAVSALPLGGYVKMLDEREGDVATDELDRAFNRQPVWKRFAIVAAGPIFNFLLAIVLYSLMYMLGVSGVKPVLGDIATDSVASRAGLNYGDEILSVNGKDVTSWQETAIALLNNGLNGGTVNVMVKNSSGAQSQHSLNIERGSLLGDNDMMDVLGFSRWFPVVPAVLGEILPDGAAKFSGLQSRDRIVMAAGSEINNWQDWVIAIEGHPNTEMEVIYQRNGKELSMLITPKAVTENSRLVGKIGAGPEISQEIRDQLQQQRVKVSYNPIASLGKGVVKTWSDSKLTLVVIWKLITGEASLKNISGPISIAQYAGITASIGLATFLGFLAIVSVSLGVLNLLPIPILDGGHLVLFAIEWVKGSPVPEAVEAIGQRVGIALLGSLMLFAVFNDVRRLFGSG